MLRKGRRGPGRSPEVPLLPQGEEMKSAKVVRRTTDDNGDIIGQYNENPLLNTLLYDVEGGEIP